MMVSLSVNQTMNAGCRLCIEHDVVGDVQRVEGFHLNIEKRLVLRPMRDNMLTL